MMEDYLWWETTYDGRWFMMEDDLWWKTTYDGKRLMIEDDLWGKTTFDGRRLLIEDNLWWKTTYDGTQLMIEDDLWWKMTCPCRSCIQLCPTPPLRSFFFSRSKDVLKKRINTAREVWSTSPLWSSPLLQSIAQQAITSPIVATPKLSKRGELYMCSECPYSGEKLMTALDHIKKKHQFKGTL